MAEKKIILAVDDMPENLMQLGSLLENYFDVRLAKSAEMALNVLNKTKVDLILLDIVMPEMLGFDFISILRSGNSLNKKTPVIFVTSHADIDIIGRAIKAGAKDYIVKPVVAETLYKKINSVIGLPEHIPGVIEGKLQKLHDAANSANKAQTDALINELLGLSKDIPHIYNPLKDIEKLNSEFDYKEVMNKVNILIHLLDLEKIQ
ncbi:MAG: response regulator [Treponema sp.]|nr:response regulator [Treponema sp.]MCL2272760.1 response regulator [Treponema sp.]